MAFNEKLSNLIREALAHHADVAEKYMFGGVCYMVHGKMCIGVAHDLMMCRIGKENYDSALERPGCSEMIFNGRPMKGYVFVDEVNWRNKKEFHYWVELCLAFNPNAKATKKKKV